MNAGHIVVCAGSFDFRVDVSALLVIMSVNRFFCGMYKSSGEGFITFLYYLS
jgi:hypothetical protein